MNIKGAATNLLQGLFNLCCSSQVADTFYPETDSCNLTPELSFSFFFFLPFFGSLINLWLGLINIAAVQRGAFQVVVKV